MATKILIVVLAFCGNAFSAKYKDADTVIKCSNKSLVFIDSRNLKMNSLWKEKIRFSRPVSCCQNTQKKICKKMSCTNLTFCACVLFAFFWILKIMKMLRLLSGSRAGTSNIRGTQIWRPLNQSEVSAKVDLQAGLVSLSPHKAHLYNPEMMLHRGPRPCQLPPCPCRRIASTPFYCITLFTPIKHPIIT